jgi:hypothetical protein
MTYTITTDAHSVVGKDERDAKRKLRAAMKAQAVKDEKANRIHEQCRLLACKSAYIILERKMRGESMPCGWRIKTPHQHNAVREVRDDSAPFGRAWRIYTDKGEAQVSPYDNITHYLENGAGFCMAIVIEGQDCELFAVGVSEEVCAWVPLYGISMDEFRKA